MAFYFKQGDRPLPGYTIQRGVGRGGFGEVYYATSDGGKEVALKYLRDNPQIELRGVQHCLNLKSPHLVDLHDVRQNPAGEFFVVMEYVNGPSLRDLMNSEPHGLGAQKAAFFLREIGKGLAYLHDRGIVHRDLKPGNIFYEDGYAKIGDYGLAKMMTASQHSGQTMSIGTVHYMAPEVGSGNYDRTIDIYAMGVILYEMLLGRVPFAGATMGEVLMKHLTAQPEVNALPAPFPDVIRKALAKDPKDRFQTIEEMSAAVFAVADVENSLAGFDTMGLTRMAAAVARDVRAGAKVHAGVRGGDGSSRSSSLPDAPPVIAAGGAGPRAMPYAGAPGNPFWQDFKRRPLGIQDSRVSFPQRNRLTTGLLGLFFGGLGLHRFYTGHNRIGVLQLIVSMFSGVGALWGIIEGIQILMNGDFRDVLGRPLLDASQTSRSGQRSMAARVFWGIVCFAFTGLAVGMTIGGTVGGPDWDFVGEPRYAIDSMHILYLVAAAAAGIGSFGLWKASHRAGLPIWRRTLRPLLICAAWVVASCGLVLESFFLVGDAQLLGLTLTAFGAAATACLWLLRGPEIAWTPSDLYWNRALSNVFIVFALVAGMGALSTLGKWGNDGFRFLRGGDVMKTVQLSPMNGYTTYDPYSRTYTTLTEVNVPERLHNRWPVAGGLLAILAVMTATEARYRRRLWCKKVDRREGEAASVAAG